MTAADRAAVLCHINLARGFRGGERQTELLVRALAQAVPSQQLIARAGGRLVERLADVPGVTVVPVRGRTEAFRRAAHARLVHAHETGGAQAALLRNLASGTPYVITRRVENVPRTDPFTRAMYRRAARVVVLSGAVARVLAAYDQRLDLCRIPSAVSHLPADPGWVARYRAAHAGRLLVGHVAAFDITKGQLTLLKAAAALASRAPQVHFVLVGAGKHESDLRAAAAGLDNVSFEGWSNEVGNYLAAFDLFAFPSEREGLGSVLLDAMQFGLPIVASNIGGIPDVVADGSNGILVPVGDADALAAAIERLADDEALRAAIAARNRAHVASFDPAVMAQRYLDVYRDIAPEVAAPRSTPPRRASDAVREAAVLHVNLARNFRGGERQTELLIKGLARHLPHQCVLARADRPLAARLYGVPGVTVVPVKDRLGAIRASRGARLIHAHETGGAQVAYARHLLERTPYLITRRVDNRPSASPVTRQMYARAARVVVLSDAIAAALAAYDPMLTVSKIPSAASNLEHDAERARRIRAAFPDRFLVGHIAALDASHKGQHVLLRAAALLERHEPRIHFVLVGSGRDEHALRRAAAGLGNVTFTGWVRDVGDYLAAIDLFVYPSLHEGLGSILLDAMQFGLPVVASAAGGIPEAIVHGDNGLLVPPGDAEALAAAVAELCSDTALRNAIAERNRSRARLYHPSTMTQRYLEIYHELVGAELKASAELPR